MQATDNRCDLGRLTLQGSQPDLHLNLLIGSGMKYKGVEVVNCVQKYLVRAMKKRKKFSENAICAWAARLLEGGRNWVVWSDIIQRLVSGHHEHS